MFLKLFASKETILQITDFTSGVDTIEVILEFGQQNLRNGSNEIADKLKDLGIASFLLEC